MSQPEVEHPVEQPRTKKPRLGDEGGEGDEVALATKASDEGGAADCPAARAVSCLTWVSLPSKDVDRAKDFYAQVFGWAWSEMKDGYWMASASGEKGYQGEEGHLHNLGLYQVEESKPEAPKDEEEKPGDEEGKKDDDEDANDANDKDTDQDKGDKGDKGDKSVPLHSSIYIRVDDMNETAKKIEVKGGRLLSDQEPIPEFGFKRRFLDSEGNALFLFSESERPHDGSARPCLVVWSEMVARDLKRFTSFFEKVLCWEFVSNGEFRCWQAKDVPRLRGHCASGGVVQLPAGASHSSDLRLTFKVASIDNTVDLVKDAGGEVVGDRLTIEGLGHEQAVRDPEGNVVGLFQLADK